MAINFSDTTPAPPTGSTNVSWQSDASGNASAYLSASPSTQPELALTGQTANVASMPLVASVPASARYRVTCYIIVTVVDPSSSTLPSVVLGWTDADNVTVQSKALTAIDTGNLLTTVHSGTFLVSAGTGTAISISTTGYTSNTPATMMYSLYCDTELL